MIELAGLLEKKMAVQGHTVLKLFDKFTSSRTTNEPGAGLMGDSRGRSPRKSEVGGGVSYIPPPKFRKYHYQLQLYFPLFSIFGLIVLKNFGLILLNWLAQPNTILNSHRRPKARGGDKQR